MAQERGRGTGRACPTVRLSKQVGRDRSQDSARVRIKATELKFLSHLPYTSTGDPLHRAATPAGPKPARWGRGGGPGGALLGGTALQSVGETR